MSLFRCILVYGGGAKVFFVEHIVLCFVALGSPFLCLYNVNKIEEEEHWCFCTAPTLFGMSTVEGL